MMPRTNTSNEPNIVLPVAQVFGTFHSLIFCFQVRYYFLFISGYIDPDKEAAFIG